MKINSMRISIVRNQGHRDSVLHEFHSNVNKVNKAVAKVRTIGDRLPLSGDRPSTTVVRIREFYEMCQNIVRIKFSCRTVKRSIVWYSEGNLTRTRGAHERILHFLLQLTTYILEQLALI